MKLRRLDVTDKDAFYRALAGFPDEPHFRFIPNIEPSGMSFEVFVERLSDIESGQGLPPGFVPDTLLFAFNDEGDIVGRCSIRHELNEFLSKYAGHLGYGVLPEYRRQGYATRILTRALEFCRAELSLERVLITCDDDNVGSIKTIENNGFTEYTKFMDETLRIPKRHYWVTTG